MDRTQGTFYDQQNEKGKIGVSSMKIFDGEDLTAGDRRRMQQVQQKDWIDQQIREKNDKKNQDKLHEENYSNQTLELNGMRKALEDEFARKRKVMEKANLEANKQFAQQKADMDRVRREEEEREKQQHIEYNTGNDFYTENTDTCQSHQSKYRVIKYHWKGMNDHQKKLIRDEQEKQRRESEAITALKKEEEKMFDLQAEQQRKMQIQLEREKNRRHQEILKNQKEYNLLKNEEQRIKIKHLYDC